MRKLALLFALLFLPFAVFSQDGGAHSYYSSITWDQSSDNLKAALKTLLSSTETSITYSHASNLDTWDVLQESDLATGSTTLVSLFYGYDNGDGNTMTDLTRSKDDMATSGCSGLWNREHVFAKSLATPALDTDTAGSGTDLHNLRAIDCQMNSTRNNNVFENSSGNAALTTNGFYPGDDYRGDVARIIMYMYIRYPDETIPNNVGYGNNYYHADIPDIFLNWNAADPVDQFETDRNNAIANRQNSRNPFIDNPFLAQLIWGGPDINDWWNLNLSPRIVIDDSSSVDENGSSTTTTTVNAKIYNYSSNVNLSFSVDSSSSAENADYSITTSSPLEFTSNEQTIPISITINSDSHNNDETIVLNFTSTARLINSTHTITIRDDEEPLIITEITDPQNSSTHGRYVEVFNSADDTTVDLSEYYLLRWTNGGAEPQSTPKSLSEFCGSTLAPNSFCLVCNDASEFLSGYGFSADADIGGGGPADSNGDDNIAIVKIANGVTYASNNSSTYTVVDMFGVAGEDGTGTGHEFEDGRAERNAGVVLPKSTWDVNDWEIDNDSGGGDGNQYAPAGFDPGYWDGATDVDTWTGRSNTSWATAGNWSSGIVPAGGDKVFIHDATNDPDISTGITLTDLTVKANGVLDIEATGSLSLSGNFSNSGTVTMHSNSDRFSAIKVSGSTSGNITYNRFVNIAASGEWDLIGSPVDGLSISSFVSTNTTGTATLATNSSAYAVGYYDNSVDTWTNYTTGTVGTAGNFDIGKGYQMGTVSGGTQILAFTGTISSSDETQSVINNDAANSGSGRRWNLVANPYPSYINANDDADDTNNFLTSNSSKIDSNFLAVYGWDADGSGYTERGHDYNSNSAVYFAPGQAFFIASDDTTGENITFTEAMQTVSPASSDDFISGDPIEPTEIFLRLYNYDEFIEDAHIKFQDNMTLGLDPGYDLGDYYQGSAISSRLVENDEGINFAHQQLPVGAMENAVIPLIINQSAGQEFRVNLHAVTIPDPNVYLEDVKMGTFTNLYEGDFVLTPTSDLEGAGRFFIHMSADTMSNEEVSTSMLNAYKEVNANYITLEGLATQSNTINATLYTVLGRKVLDTTLNNNMNTQTISTVGMAAGIYVIELESGNDRLTKKFIIH